MEKGFKKVLANQETPTTSQIRSEFTSGGSVQSQFDETSARIVVKYLMVYQEARIIGGRDTYLAVKNPRSFMIGTSSYGFKVIENLKEIHKSQFIGFYGVLSDMVYVDYPNCYFLLLGNKIYRKDIDENPPYKFLSTGSKLKPGAFFRDSKINKRILINCTKRHVSFINRRGKFIEFSLPRFCNKTFCDYKLFGEKEDRIVGINTIGFVAVFFLNLSRKKICLFYSLQMNLIEDKYESAFSLAVCTKNKFSWLELSLIADFPDC